MAKMADPESASLQDLQAEAEDLRRKINRLRTSLGRFFVEKQEIIDLMVANTEVLADNPDFGKALAGIWYDTVTTMASDTPEGAAARAAMGQASGTDQAGFESQLAATKLFDKPADAVGFVQLYPMFSSVRTARTWILNDLFVAPAARRGGVARALLEAAAAFAREDGAAGLSLETGRDNAAARALYRAAGWHEDETQWYSLSFSKQHH